jgi:uncharacterized membrane protein YbhN (UPF0104 family)
MALKYEVLLTATDITMPLMRMVKINFISRFYGLFVPNAVGAYMVRWYKVTKGQENKGAFATLTIVERLIFILLQLIAGVGFLITADRQLGEIQDTIIYLSTCGILLCTGFIILAVANHRIPILKTALPKLAGQLPGQLSKIASQVLIDTVSMRQIVSTFALSGLWLATFLFRVYLIFLALDLPFSFSEAAWMSSLIMLIQLLPISQAGIGVREGAYAYVFNLYGQPPEQGVAVGLLFFSQMIAISAVGGVLDMIERIRTFREI